MNDDMTGSMSAGETATDWERVRGMSDADVHAAVVADPESLPTDDAFWAKARLVMPKPKETVTIRLDSDLLAWLRRERGYQTRINAILRAYMAAQPDTSG